MSARGRGGGNVADYGRGERYVGALGVFGAVEAKGGAMVSAERQRLDEADGQGIGWRHWGPYLSEQQSGTVREDASRGGGDNGAGIGASHQTGWTGIVGVLPLLFHGDVGSWVRAWGRAARSETGRAS